MDAMSNLGNHNPVAVLVFARSPEAESSVKIISENNQHNLLLWQSLQKKLTKTLQKSGLPYFIFDETRQTGNSFGDKITNAINKVFYNGYERVLLIGNDCPELSSNHLVKAAAMLQEKSMVIGPDFSGGAYLIGISKNCFNAENFSQLPWQTPSVFKSLLNYCKIEDIGVLSRFYDLNSQETINKAKQRLKKFSGLKKILFSCFSNASPVVVKTTQPFYFFFFKTPFNKGSPQNSLSFL